MDKPKFRPESERMASINEIQELSRAFDGIDTKKLIDAAWKEYQAERKQEYDRQRREIFQGLDARARELGWRFVAGASETRRQIVAGVALAFGAVAVIQLFYPLAFQSTSPLQTQIARGWIPFTAATAIAIAIVWVVSSRFKAAWLDAFVVAVVLAGFFTYSSRQLTQDSNLNLATKGNRAIVEALTTNAFRSGFQQPEVVTNVVSKTSVGSQPTNAVEVTIKPDYVATFAMKFSEQLDGANKEPPPVPDVVATFDPNSKVTSLRFVDKSEAFTEMRPGLVVESPSGSGITLSLGHAQRVFYPGKWNAKGLSGCVVVGYAPKSAMKGIVAEPPSGKWEEVGAKWEGASSGLYFAESLLPSKAESWNSTKPDLAKCETVYANRIDKMFGLNTSEMKITK